MRDFINGMLRKPDYFAACDEVTQQIIRSTLDVATHMDNRQEISRLGTPPPFVAHVVEFQTRLQVRFTELEFHNPEQGNRIESIVYLNEQRLLLDTLVNIYGGHPATDQNPPPFYMLYKSCSQELLQSLAKTEAAIHTLEKTYPDDMRQEMHWEDMKKTKGISLPSSFDAIIAARTDIETWARNLRESPELQPPVPNTNFLIRARL